MIDLNEELKDLFGKPVVSKDQKPMALKDALIMALHYGHNPKETMGVDDVVKTHELGAIIAKTEQCHFTAEQTVLLKRRVVGLINAIGMSPLVVGTILQILEPEA